MRIAYVCADRGVPVFGQKGCSIHVQEVVRALVLQGAHVELLAARVGGSAPQDLQHVRLHQLPLSEASDSSSRERASLRANIALRRLLERLAPIDAVYERYSLWSFAAMDWARRAHVPGLLEINAPLIDEQVEHRGLDNRGAATRVARRSFAAAQALIAVSDGVAEWAEEFPEAAGRVRVVPNGVDPSRFQDRSWPRQRTGFDGEAAGGAFVIGFVGTLKTWHGLPVLVEAFADLHAEDPHTRLLLVGDGPERGAVEEALTRRGIRDAAALTGAVPAQEIPSLLASMDVAVAPYSARPGFYFSPLKVLEYMAAGVPVVASRLGQLQELVTHDHTGLLCAADDPAALAASLGRLRASSALRRRLGDAARAAVLHDHTWQEVTRRIFAVADLALPKSSSSAPGVLTALEAQA